MTGIGILSDRGFLQAFQVIDKVIQNNQAIFVFIWIGSVVTLVVATALGVWQLEGTGRILIVIAAVAYLGGAQLPTFTINIPLNNRSSNAESGHVGCRVAGYRTTVI